MSEILDYLVNTFVTSSVLILFIFMLRFIHKSKINPRIQYALWIIVAVRLIIPINSQWTLEINNIFPQVKTYDFIFDNNVNAYKTDQTEYIDANLSYSQNSTGYNSSTISNVENYERPLVIQSAVNQWSLTNILVIVWLIGVISILGVFIIRNTYFYRNTIRGIKPYNLPDDIYDGSAKMVGLKRKIPVCLSQKLTSPCLIGVINPIIILTENVIHDHRAIRLALIHEMVHYKQKDNIIRFIELILCAIYWFNPLVWLAAKAATNDAELACDSIVLKKINPSEHYNYCLTLLSIASNSKHMVTAMSEGGRKIQNRIGMILKQPKRLVNSILILLVSIILGIVSFINISVADNFTSDELFTIKSSISSTSEFISLGNIHNVYNLLTSLPNPNDYYEMNTLTIDNLKHGYSIPNNLDITFERYTFLRGPGISEGDVQTMDKNALQLFDNVYDLENITFTFIDSVPNSRRSIKNTPIAYSYKRSQIENKFGRTKITPHVYKRVMESSGGNNMILVFGYSDLYARLGIEYEEFQKNPKIAREVFSKLGAYSDSWASGGKCVYRFSPNPIYSNWFDLLVVTDGYGNIESHGISLPKSY